MSFDLARFEAAKFEARHDRVRLDSLAAFFGEGEEPVWEVRGLTATELHRAMEAGRRQTSIDSIVKAISLSGDQVQAVRKVLGLTADTPGEIAKRVELLVMGSVSPKVEHPIAVKLGEHFPVEFMQLTNAITDLTGQGSDLEKPAAASQPTTA